MPSNKEHKYSARFEVKYLVPSHLRVAVIRDIQSMTSRDAYAVGNRQSYGVRSLYYDSRRFSAYYEKMAGILRRLKFRIRTYKETPDVKYLEIKERMSNRIIKRKVRLNPEILNILMHSRNPLAHPDFSDSSVLKEFYYYKCTLGLEPLLTIEYRRRPFVGKTHRNLRITFDFDITTSSSRELDQQGGKYRILSSGYSVLEIKFNNTMPHWIHSLVKKYSLQDQAYSKYCLGLEKLVKKGVLHIV